MTTTVIHPLKSPWKSNLFVPVELSVAVESLKELKARSIALHNGFGGAHERSQMFK